ncbi:hypothetical protein ABT272_45745 [Streptomyces sp900105245]|uniref:Uncharacterized protein n=1 Tax=Streptomyces sp. 900105245 TaxID=3154379 RepID=A0ABV1ULZ0_9ACTN
MRSIIGVYKTEPIKPRRPWTTLSDIEFGSAEYVDWFTVRYGTTCPPSSKSALTELSRNPRPQPQSEIFLKSGKFVPPLGATLTRETESN